LVGWNDTQAEYPKDKCIHELFEEQAERTPENVAVVYEDEQLTYRELNEKSNQLAHYLRKLGVGPEVLVGICVERSVEMVVGLLGILKAGGAYVPLDPQYPKERLTFMLNDTQIKVLLALKRLVKRLSEYEGQVVCMDAQWADIAKEIVKNPVKQTTAENLAYLIYTSGSTGHPRGVLLAHTGLFNLVRAQAKDFEIVPESRVLQFASVCFDASVSEIFTALVTGATLCLGSQDALMPGVALIGLMRKQLISVATLPPSVLAVLPVAELPELRTLVSAGETCTAEAVSRWGSDRRFINAYGPTEVTVCGSLTVCKTTEVRPSIGKAISNVQIYILDKQLKLVPIGVVGELHIGGAGLARGYLNHGDLTAERFIPNPYGREPGGRLYRTGDLGRYLADGNIEFIGRVDHQVKIRGFRIELGEIESVLGQHPAVQQSIVIAREDEPGEKRLVGYVVAKGEAKVSVEELRGYLKGKLPEYMVPAFMVMLEKLPLTANGKVDQKALPLPEGRQTAVEYVAPRSEIEKLIAGVWREMLKVEEVGIRDNFFDIGGHSLLLLRVHGRLEQLLERKLTLVELFQYPTISRLAEHLTWGAEPFLQGIRERAERQQPRVKDAVAVIGMVGRFPGARNLEEFWRNLEGGVESISFFTDEELIGAGIDPQVLSDPNYVKARGVIEETDLFDARFFGYSPREAELIDPQQRVFLEYAWEALEQAGYDAERYEGTIGVYAGMSPNSYMFNLLSNPELMSSTDGFQLMISSGADYLSTRVSYKLNLKGPSVNVETACSTSLVAVEMACRSLLNKECDMALAGGVSVHAQQKAGYYYQPEGKDSPDGHCRAFDARAQGIVGGNGVGIVVLKRLSEALSDGDTIHAVIKGSAINNDGSLKVGYTAPSVSGQAEVIAMAQALGGVEARSISYVEAHGTGTALGDPIEIAALTQAFGVSTKEKGFCAIGSVKSNVGHLDAAAGVAGLIKTVLALEHGKIPASLYYEQPNPKIDFANSPFYVNGKLREWERKEGPRRAGVSAFGIGGTNAHVVVEEAPVLEPSGESRSHQLWVLSARSENALEQATENLLKHLRAEPGTNLADAAYTLQVGRKGFGKRRMLVCAGREETIQTLESLKGVITSAGETEPKPVVFLFSGGGAQYEGMGWGLYQQEKVFREEVDRCSEMLKGELGMDLRGVMYPGEQWGSGTESLRQMWLTLPALFVVEYALAKLWKSWGIEPEAMMGHSIGEYVAACLAGVFTVEEGLKLVAARGRLMQEAPAGLMISVELSGVEAEELLKEAELEKEVSVAAVNGPKSSVLSGPAEMVEKLEKELGNRGLDCQRLETSHAAHSGMMDGVVERFVEEVRKVKLRAPVLPYISNVTGKWITKEEATDPNYWGRHLRQTVRFSDGLQEILKRGEQVLLEVGPGQTLSNLAKMHLGKESGIVVVSTLRHREDVQEDEAYILKTLGRLWVSGVKVKWAGFYARERRHRIPLPTYPFERQRYWVERQKTRPAARRALEKMTNLDEWFYTPSWKRVPLKEETGKSLVDWPGNWLVFFSGGNFSEGLIVAMRERGRQVVLVKAGPGFRRESEESYSINPREASDYQRLLKELGARDWTPDGVLHLWLFGEEEPTAKAGNLERFQALGFYSLLYLAQAIGDQCAHQKMEWKVITDGVQKVTGEERLRIEKATVLGPCRVVGLEYPNIKSSHIDIEIPRRKAQQQKLVEQLLAEMAFARMAAESLDLGIAYRGGYRWTQTLEPTPLRKVEGKPVRLREKGVYLITGGLGGIGLVLAEYLAETVQARLVLAGRSGLPSREEWERWLESHESNDGVSAKIRKVQLLEKLGAEVMVLSVDVSDEVQMKAGLSRVYKRFGEIHGVIHSAGLGGGGIMQIKTREEAERVLAPKVKGTWVLGELFAKKELDFFVLCSSLASRGVPGLVDYCAANAFLDAYAQRNETSTPVIAVNWDAWQEVGMGATLVLPAQLEKHWKTVLKTGILPTEGKEVFSRILNSSHAQILISTKDPFGFLENSEAGVSNINEEITPPAISRAGYPRPELSDDYVAPGNKTEQQIAQIWEEVLGISGPGIHDNFFELGGHSLLATQVTTRMRKILNVELPLRTLFENPTIAGLSGFVRWAAKEKKAATSATDSHGEEGTI
jgi:amino acid adenylation domain-containing protein